MLDSKKYNISDLKKWSKDRFYSTYKGKMFNIDEVWEWLHPKKKKSEK